MPEPRVFGAWTAAVVEQANAALTDIEEKKGRVVAVLGGHEDIEVQAHCKPDGVVSLKAVAISGFRTVRVPRVWDSPERREAERNPRDELGRLARRFKTALDEWTKSVSELATWIRYSPPPPGAKPVEPWACARPSAPRPVQAQQPASWPSNDPNPVHLSRRAATKHRVERVAPDRPVASTRDREDVAHNAVGRHSARPPVRTRAQRLIGLALGKGDRVGWR